jgi:hypothetical protein
MFRKKWHFAPLILLAIAGFSLVTMLLWNALLPVLFHFPLITFWQALGLLVLSRLLLSGGMHHKGWRHHREIQIREKWMHMTPEEREKFSQRLKCYRYPWMGHSGFEEKQDEKDEHSNS